MLTRTCVLLLFLAACGDQEQDPTTVAPDAPTLIRVEVTYVGEPPQYAYASCDAGACGSVELDSSGSAVFVAGEGTRAITLSVPRNCTVDSPSQRTVTTVSGSTVDARFTIRCVPFGTARIAVLTTGEGTRPGAYFVGWGDVACLAFFECDRVLVTAGSTAEVTALGPTEFFLVNELSNCRTTSGTPVLVDVLPGSTVDVRFDVQCD
jgi:hypothetical protein